MTATPPPLTDQQLRDAVIAAITEDGLKPRGQQLGLVDAMLAVVWPELDRMRAERDQARAQLAAVLALPGIGPDALELMDPEQYHQAIGYNDGLAASTHAINDLAAEGS